MPCVKLTPKNELFAWIVGSCAAVTAFICSHTFYVTASTFWYGVPLVGSTTLLFWLRFRHREMQLTKMQKIVSASALVLLSTLVAMYLLGVTTYYE